MPTFSDIASRLAKRSFYLNIYNKFNTHKVQILNISFFSTIIVATYHLTIMWLFQQWLTDSENSHGIIVPFISLYIIWHQRDRFFYLDFAPKPIMGTFIIILSYFLLLTGRLGAFVQLEAISLLIVLFGIIIFLLGWDFMKALAFPLLYLLFMIPVFNPIIDKIHMPFQLISADIGAWILKSIGFSIFQTGIYIQMPNILIEVAEACSGAKFFISVMAIGIPLVYLTQKSWPKAIFVLFTGMIIVVLSNGLRVAIAGIMGNNYGVAMLHGPRHIFEGIFVAQIGWVGVFLVNWLVLKIPAPDLALCERWKTDNLVLDSQQKQKLNKLNKLNKLLFILSCLFIALFYYTNFLAIPKPVPPNYDMANFPKNIDRWHSINLEWAQITKYFHPMDYELSRTYQNNNGDEIKLYIGYVTSQNKDKRLISYLDKELFANSSPINIFTKDNRLIKANYTSIVHNNIRYKILFWYRTHNTSEYRRYLTKFKVITDGVFYRRNNGAVIIIGMQATGFSDKMIMDKNTASFLSELLSELNILLPLP